MDYKLKDHHAIHVQSYKKTGTLQDPAILLPQPTILGDENRTRVEDHETKTKLCFTATIKSRFPAGTLG